LLNIFEDESFKKGVVQRVTRPIFFSDQKDDARCSFYFLNVP